jgi:SAM-dependent methyltransferase
MILRSILKKLVQMAPYDVLDEVYVPLDKQHVRRTRNIRLIPGQDSRRGGKYSYAEWGHVIGIIQTLLFIHAERRENLSILDVGCGTGLVGIASEQLLGNGGRYVGMDVMQKDIQFCRGQYPAANFEFIHFDAKNPAYAPTQAETKANWNVESAKFDVLIALSVWTHLNEEDALYYIKEVSRVLKPGGKAIITFFILDDAYRESLPIRQAGQKGRFHNTTQDKWIFDTAAYASKDWLCPKWAQVPEDATGITSAGFERLVKESGLERIAYYPGNWKEKPGLYFQDVVVFQKPSAA